MDRKRSTTPRVGDGRPHGPRGRALQPQDRPARRTDLFAGGLRSDLFVGSLPGPAAVLAGRGAGRLQEDIVQRGPAQPDVADADLRPAQPGGGLLHQLEPVAGLRREGEPVRALVRLRLATAHPRQHRLRPVTLPRAGQFYLQDLAADPVLELVPGSSSTAANCPVRPISSRTAAGSPATSWPRTSARPASGASSVARMRTSVVLPALLRVLCPLTRGNRQASAALIRQVSRPGGLLPWLRPAGACRR
jgi:hypothetical protein